MKKKLKIAGIIIGAIIALALVAVLTLPLWIGTVARPVANVTVPQLTKTDFNLGKFSFNWYNGRLTVGDVQLSNPEGFDQRMAFTLGEAFIDVDMSTIFSDPIVIEKIEVREVFVSYLDGPTGTNNFDTILANVMDTLGIEQESDEAEDSTTNVNAPDVNKQDLQKLAKNSKKESETETVEDETPGRKVIIDDVVIDSVVVQMGLVTLPLKVPIHLSGIGRDLGGINAENAWKEIFSQFMRALMDIGTGLKNIGQGLIDIGGKGADSAVKTTTDAVNKATDMFKGLMK